MSTLHERTSPGGSGENDDGSPRTSAGTTATTINSVTALSAGERAGMDSISGNGTVATSTTAGTSVATNAGASTVRGQASTIPLPFSGQMEVEEDEKEEDDDEEEEEEVVVAAGKAAVRDGEQDPKHAAEEAQAKTLTARLPSAADLSVSTAQGSPAVVGALFEQQGYALGGSSSSSSSKQRQQVD